MKKPIIGELLPFPKIPRELRSLLNHPPMPPHRPVVTVPCTIDLLCR